MKLSEYAGFDGLGLPMHIWPMLREGVTPEINAIATITVTFSLLFLVLALRLLRQDGVGQLQRSQPLTGGGATHAIS